MALFTTREEKGSPLSFSELDNNFKAVENAATTTQEIADAAAISAVNAATSADESEASAVQAANDAASVNGNPLGAYADGLVFNSHNDYVSENGLFRLKRSVNTPYTTNTALYPLATDDDNLSPWSDVDTLKAIALGLNVPRSSIIDSTDTTTPIPAYIYDASQQKTYSVPSGAQGKFAQSVVLDQLTTTEPVTYTMVKVSTVSNGENQIQNSNFIINGPLITLTSSPQTFVTNDEVKAGFFCEGAVTGLTYIDGKLNATTGKIYTDVPNTGGLEFLTLFTASIANTDLVANVNNVSWSLINGDTVYRVVIDFGAGASDVFSCKFQTGLFADGHDAGYFTGRVYHALSVGDAINGSGNAISIIITNQGGAPYKIVTQAVYDDYPALAKFTDSAGRLWGIATTSRASVEWFYTEDEIDHAQAWQTCFDLKARYIQAKPGFDYQWLTPTYTDTFGNKYWTTPRANFKIFGNDATINTANLGNVNLSIMSSRFAPAPIGVYEVERLIIRAANRGAGTNKIVRTCFDAFNVMKTKISDCTWYGGDHSTLVGCDNNDPKARMDVIRPTVYNVLTIQIDPADTSFFYGHCANGSITGGVAFQDGVDLAQFCEVHESNWEVSKNRAFGFRVFAFVDNGGYVSAYPQETSRIIFSNNIVSCMNALVVPTDATAPFRVGGKVSNITIESNQVHFIPTIAGRSELPQGIFAPSDALGNGVETVENIIINDNLITFADFGAQITDCRFLSIQSKFARVITFTDNTVRGWSAAKINVDTLEALTWTGNKISLRYGDVSAADSYTLDLRATTMSDIDFNNNNWGITEITAQKQVMFIQFTTASNLSFVNEKTNNGNVTSYFYMGVSYQQLLDAGTRLVNIPLKSAGFSFPSIADGGTGVAELNLFEGGVVASREIDVTVENIVSGSFPTTARILSKFRLGVNSPLLSAPVYACQGAVGAVGLTSLANVTLNTQT